MPRPCGHPSSGVVNFSELNRGDRGGEVFRLTRISSHHGVGDILTKRVGKSLDAIKPVGYIELLRNNYAFRQLWLGQVVSQMGDWFNTIALYTIILNLTGSGRDVGLLLVARFLPSFVFGPLSGVLADRFSRRTIMIVSDLLRAVVVLGFLLVRRADQLWIVYVLTVLQLGFSTFFEPAKTAAIPSIVSDRELVAANAISSVTWSVMLTLGAAIGGLITGWLGTDVAFVLDSLTYLLSAALIASVRLPKRPNARRAKLTVGRALGITQTIEGARYVKHRPRVLALLLVKPAGVSAAASSPCWRFLVRGSFQSAKARLPASACSSPHEALGPR